MADYEKEIPIGNKTCYKSISVQAVTPRGPKGTYNNALKDHYLRLLEKLGILSMLRKCIRNGMKIKGEFDIVDAYITLQQSENRLDLIKRIIKYLNKEYLDENEVLRLLNINKTNLEKAKENIENNFTDTDKFQLGTTHSVRKAEIVNKANLLLDDYSNYINFFVYLQNTINNTKEAEISV